MAADAATETRRCGRSNRRHADAGAEATISYGKAKPSLEFLRDYGFVPGGGNSNDRIDWASPTSPHGQLPPPAVALHAPTLLGMCGARPAALCSRDPLFAAAAASLEDQQRLEAVLRSLPLAAVEEAAAAAEQERPGGRETNAFAPLLVGDLPPPSGWPVHRLHLILLPCPAGLVPG